MIQVIELGSEYHKRNSSQEDKDFATRDMSAKLEMGIAKLKWIEPSPSPAIQVIQRALVIGGGIAGMKAALGGPGGAK